MRGVRREDFVEHACELLAALGTVRAKAMFGGYGLYVDETFCAIVMRDTLYMRAGEAERADYEALGCRPFRPFADKPMVLSYFEVPAEVMDSRDAFAAWAARAVAAGRAAADGPPPRTKARSLAPSRPRRRRLRG